MGLVICISVPTSITLPIFCYHIPGVAKCGVVWYGKVRQGKVSYSYSWFGKVRQGAVGFGVARQGQARQGFNSYSLGKAWRGLVLQGGARRGLVMCG